jgi:hypothetical protein
MRPSCRVDYATCIGDVFVNTAKVIFADHTALTPRSTKCTTGIFAQYRAHMRKGSRSYHTAWPDEETNEPLLADHRNFYKVEKWNKIRTGPKLIACSMPAAAWKKRGKSSLQRSPIDRAFG